MFNYPPIFFVFSWFILWLASQIGASLGKRRPLREDEREDFGVIQAANLTLLGLLIGFTFSMAVSRYDLRKTYEEAEANAIGTEYVRAGLLPESDAATVHTQLKKYVDLRVSFYQTHDHDGLGQINSDTEKLQSDMWSVVQAAAVARPTPVTALAAAGMNDVLNSQGYTQAAWWNRIPVLAWVLLIVIAVVCNVLIGYGVRSNEARQGMIFVLPLVVSISFFLISDIDSPRRGFIHVTPQNLIALSQSLRNQ
jgi:hypothetical protein